MSKQTESPFKTELRANIKAAIARLDRGTVGIGAACLWQLTRIDSPHSPRGTNCAYVARQVFNEIVAEPAFRKFVY